MTTIGTRLARVQLMGFALFILTACIAIGLVEASVFLRGERFRGTNRLTSILHIAELLSDNRAAEAGVLLVGNSATMMALMESNKKIDQQFMLLKSYSEGVDEQRDDRRLEQVLQAYRVEQLKLATIGVRQGRAAALRHFYGVLLNRYRHADTVTKTLTDNIAQRSTAWNRFSVNITHVVTLFLLAIVALGSMLALALRRSVSAKIFRPLAAITASLGKLAAGDTHVAVSGGERQDEIGELARALEIFRQHALALEAAHRETREAQLEAENLARNDVLTGLPNRRQFVETLKRATHDPDVPCAVLLIDLDRFKPINDIHGHEAGDTVLCELADRFVAHRHLLGSVARLGGDEFAVVLPIKAGANDAMKAARLIADIVSQPIEIAGTPLEVAATIGVALYPQDGQCPSTLLRAADLAMYCAKTKVAGPFQFFEASMRDQVERRALLDVDLRRAISADEIRPYYQPLVSIDGGAVVGFEILARWDHPMRGTILPDEFIYAADERGLLTDMTYRILRRACEDARHWPQHLTLSLNLAPSQLSDPLMASRLQAILAQTGMAPERIEIEVTENALITDLATTKTLLSTLQKMGMTISLDDFGTGYASLYQLRDLKFDKIKIDRSFVERLADNGEGTVIVQAMIGLGKGLGLKTIAEGIEGADQLDQLSAWGCDFGQGYLFGKAMTAAQAGQLVGSKIVEAKDKRTRLRDAKPIGDARLAARSDAPPPSPSPSPGFEKAI